MRGSGGVLRGYKEVEGRREIVKRDGIEDLGL